MCEKYVNGAIFTPDGASALFGLCFPAQVGYALRPPTS